MAKKSRWIRIGELRKTKRADMLTGNVEFEELGIKLKVVAFIKTNEQKKSRNEPDIVILFPKEEDESDVKLPDELFD